MRISIIISLICFLQAGFISAQEQREFTVNGKFPSAYYDGLTVYLSEIDYTDTNAMIKKDSATIEGDKFSFAGALDKAIAIRYLTISDNDETTALVVLEPGTIEVAMSEIPVLSGTIKNEELSSFTKEQIKRRGELERILGEAQDLHRAGALDEMTSNKLEANFEHQKELMQQDVYDFISKNVLNELGEFFFTIYAGNLKTSQLETLYASATPEFRQAFLVKSLMNQHVWSLGELREGKKFRGMKLKNLEGETEDFSIHLDKGNVILIDFWASWCGPCIKVMPDLVALYDTYKDKGFEIIGISLDENERNWESAVNRLGMKWIQYIDDLGGWRGSVAKEYNITRIPQTFLLDREGKIAGHDLHGQKLINKIEQLLKEE